MGATRPHGERFAAQGRAEGLVIARREDLLIMFELAGFTPTPPQRAKIETCADPQQLERWARQLLLASSLDELLET